MIRFKPRGGSALYWMGLSGVESRPIHRMAFALIEDALSDASELDKLAMVCAKRKGMKFLSETPLGDPKPAPEIGPRMFWVVWECA